MQQLIDNLHTVMATVAKDGDQFSGVVQRLQQLITGLAEQRDPIGEAITALDAGTASLADLMTQARPPLSGTVDQLTRLAPLLASDDGKARLDLSLQKAPANYRKLVRLGSYGSFINQYLCGMNVRVTDLQGRTATSPWIMQTTGRCGGA